MKSKYFIAHWYLLFFAKTFRSHRVKNEKTQWACVNVVATLTALEELTNAPPPGKGFLTNSLLPAPTGWQMPGEKGTLRTRYKMLIVNPTISYEESGVYRNFES